MAEEDLDSSARSDSAAHDGPSFNVVAAALPGNPIQCIVQSGATARINISRTLFSCVLSASATRRVQSAPRALVSWMNVFFWISQCVIAVLPVIDRHSSRMAISYTLSGVGTFLSLPALAFATANLSVDMLRILPSENDFRAGVILNTVQWIFVAMAFEFDCRACVCAVEWWVVQLALSGDADFRLHGQQLHAPLVSCFITVCYLFYSLFGLLQRSFQPVFTISGQSTSVNDILQWTAPMLCVILLKSVHIQRRMQVHPNDRSETSKTVNIYCSTVKARLRLAKVSRNDSQSHANACGREGALGARLFRSHSTLTYVDVTKTFAEISFPLPEDGISTASFTLLYSVGVFSFTAACISAFLGQIHAVTLPHSLAAPALSLASLVGASLFCGLTARFYQRELLRELFHTFDVVFSSLQYFTGLFLICATLQWDSRCVNVITWALWFHWILCFDALTPPVRAYLRLRKLAVTPVALILLYGFGGPFVLLYGYTNTKLVDREIVAHIRLSTLVLSRMLTLWLWCGHWVWDLGVRDDREFVFLKDRIQYTVPQDLLVASLSSTGNAIVPINAIGPRLPSMLPLTPTTSSSPSPAPER